MTVAERLSVGLVDSRLPHRMVPGLRAYVLDKRPPGGFLAAVIANDLRGAVGRADRENLAALPLWVGFFTDHCPAECWGSNEALEAWLVSK